MCVYVYFISLLLSISVRYQPHISFISFKLYSAISCLRLFFLIKCNFLLGFFFFCNHIICFCCIVYYFMRICNDISVAIFIFE